MENDSFVDQTSGVRRKIANRRLAVPKTSPNNPSSVTRRRMLPANSREEQRPASSPQMVNVRNKNNSGQGMPSFAARIES
jgi:hypothetical protein